MYLPEVSGPQRKKATLAPSWLSGSAVQLPTWVTPSKRDVGTRGLHGSSTARGDIFDLRNLFFRHDKRVSFPGEGTLGDLPGSCQGRQVQHNSGWPRMNSNLYLGFQRADFTFSSCLQPRQQARIVTELRKFTSFWESYYTQK